MLIQKKIIKNVLWLSTEKVLRLIFAIVTTGIVARFLGPDKYGELMFVVALVSFVQILSGFGMDSVIVKELTNKDYMFEEILGTAMFMRGLFGVLLYVIVCIVCYLLVGYVMMLYLVCAVGLSLMFYWGNTIDLYYQSRLENKMSVILKSAAFILSNLLKIACVILALNVVYFGIVYSIEFLLLLVGFVFLFIRNTKYDKFRFSKETAKDLLFKSWPYVITALTVSVYYRADQIMLRYFMGENEVGIYTASSVIATNLYFIPVILINVMMPIMAKKKEAIMKNTADL